MLSLKELEESLDHALNNETYESLTDWFQKRELEKANTPIVLKGE